LASSTSEEIGEAEPHTLVVPLGATEQHGPHLPMATDTLVAVAWADEVGRRLPRSIVAPPLPYGSSGEHQAFAGTLSIGRDALRTVLIELARSAIGRFDRLLYLSGHGGNAEALHGAVTTLRGEGRDVIGLVPSWPDRVTDAHAGRIETSLLLHLAPDLVRLEQARPGNTSPLPDIIDRLRTDGLAGVTPNGVLGDPAGATAEEGRALLDDLVERTVTQVGLGLDEHR
jgi:creatinine amidohydrolase